MRVRLSEIMELIGGGTPKTSVAEYWDGNIPWLSVKDFNNDFRYVYHTEKKITQLGLENSSTKLLKKDDIIISARGTVGELAMIPYEMAFNQSCYGIRAKENVADSTFLYYLLKHNVRILKRNTHGSVFDTITRETFDNIEVDLPELKIQKKIANILSDYDTKIELNNEIFSNLEQQAQILYRNIFIDNCCINWKIGKLSDLITVKYGKDHKKLEDGIFPVYGSGGIMRYVEKPLYTYESVLIPRKGTLNNVMYVNEPFWSVDTMFYTEMKRENVAKFVFHFVRSKDLLSLNAGSAVPSMTTDILNNMELYIPDEDTLKSFEDIVSPLYEKMHDIKNENRLLLAIRDCIIPKLLNGEIDLADIDI